MIIRKQHSSLLVKQTPRRNSASSVQRFSHLLSRPEKSSTSIPSEDPQDPKDIKIPLLKISITRKSSCERSKSFLKSTTCFCYNQGITTRENPQNDSYINVNSICPRPLANSKNPSVSFQKENCSIPKIHILKPQSGRSGKLRKGSVFHSVKKLFKARLLAY